MDQKTSQIVNVVRDESEKTRGVVREESRNIQRHIDVKTNEIVGVVREEGRATRDHVTQKTSELKAHVTSEANGIKDKVGEAWRDIVDKGEQHFGELSQAQRDMQSKITNHTEAIIRDSKNGFGRLGDVYAAACVTAKTKENEFKQAQQKYFAMMSEAREKSNGVGSAIKGLIKDVDAALQLSKVKKWWEVLVDGIFGTISSALSADIGGAYESLTALEGAGASLVYMGSADDRLKTAADRLNTVLIKFVTVMRDLAGLALGNPSDFIHVRWNLNQPGGPGGIPISKPRVAPPYDLYFTKVREADVAAVFAGFDEVMGITCDVLRDEVKDGKWPGNIYQINGAVVECYEITDELGAIHDRLRETLRYLELMREFLAAQITAEKQCTAAEGVTQFAKKRSRALQQRDDAVGNLPFDAMHYTALTRLLLDYQLQEAGFQFCKFYEFRNGGVAPPMCGDNKYYTLAQILEMRAWRPPVYKRVNVRALLPTKRSSDPRTGRAYPFVSLSALAAGKPVTVELPLWDVAWLKKYGWLSNTTRPDDVPSVYVDTFRVYLPLHGNASSDDVGGGRGLAVAVTAEASGRQRLRLKSSDREFELPPQAFRFDATYGSSVCHDDNLLQNPYHEAAQCVQPDGSSDVCFRDAGRTPTQDEHGLLPSLFSTWRLQATVEKGDGSLAPVTPKRRISLGDSEPVSLPELNVIVDLSIVQIRSGTATRDVADTDVEADEREGTCCGANAYRVSRAQCLPCPPGSNATLFGYSCI
ncbi:hypothetical protein ATCC90586_009089 [Pythium insidiosum]|nr:hypothetical protein ATCC90586_009089 [Pythium insidiosum]